MSIQSHALPRRPIVQALLLAGLLLVWPLAHASATVRIDFENPQASPVGSPATVHLDDQYQDRGVRFTPAPGLVVLDYSARPGFAHSESQVVRACYNQEFCLAPLEMHFTRPERFLRLWAGFDGVVGSEGTGRRTLVLTAFDLTDAVVGRAEVTFPASPTGHPVRTPLEIRLAPSRPGLPSPEMVRATLEFSPVTTIGTPLNGLVIDDLELASGLCLEPTNLCLNDDRFRIQVRWRDFQGGTGMGRSIPLTDDSGGFWFFHPDNVELIFKIIDGRLVNNHWWVFYGALSNVEYTITVVDTATSEERTYFNPLRTFASRGDAAAFPE